MPTETISQYAERVCRTVAEVLNVSVEELKPSDCFATDLECDSLDSLEIVMAIEEEFEIELPDRDAENIHTVEQLITYVETAVRD